MTFLKLSHYSIRLAIRSDNLLFDGAYDGKPAYDAVIDDSGAAAIVIPPRANVVNQSTTDVSDKGTGISRHIAAISRGGQMKWQGSRGYGKRWLPETAIGRYKSVIGCRLRARSLTGEQTEIAIGCAALNRMLDCARPKSVRRRVDCIISRFKGRHSP
ncbi:hypothetical protein GA0061101_1046 [Rhizobium lusitanum]|uniref:Transposase IS4-like domain-containing protein n=1 Tax=Rhizobium lusitanum TaxID=293958 RepID=A0A1C3V0U9_9HYPH|nr:hypothetical protein GA0061101_1046 [Rhizobium lusitanum]